MTLPLTTEEIDALFQCCDDIRGPVGVMFRRGLAELKRQRSEPTTAAPGDRGALCTFGVPGERKRHWILKFEDADLGDMHFDDACAAHTEFERAETNWNCTLYVTATRPVEIAEKDVASALEDWADVRRDDRGFPAGHPDYLRELESRGDRMAAALTLQSGRIEAGLRHEAVLQTRLTSSETLREAQIDEALGHLEQGFPAAERAALEKKVSDAEAALKKSTAVVKYLEGELRAHNKREMYEGAGLGWSTTPWDRYQEFLKQFDATQSPRPLSAGEAQK